MDHYDLWGREARQHPQALYARIREEASVCHLISPRTGNAIWLFTRYDDVFTVLKDARFIKDYNKIAPPAQIEESSKSPSGGLDRHLLTLDPPDHTRLRLLVQNTFTPKIIGQLEPRMREHSAKLISAMQAKGEADLIEDFALPLPIIVIAEMLGIPAEDHKQFRAWTRGLLYSSDSMEAASVGMQILRFFLSIIEQRRADPRDDLITALLKIEEEGDRLTTGEMLSMLFLLLIAGHETTVNLIGNGIIALLEHPDQLAMLRAQPERITRAVEEILRYNGPIENTFTRFAEQDVEWGGCQIRYGDVVLAGVMAANHDPRQFAQPEAFDITREPNKHVSFGHGIHYCLGAPLARLEGGIAINMLINQLPALSLAVSTDQLEWNEHIQLRGVKRLPVKF